MNSNTITKIQKRYDQITDSYTLSVVRLGEWGQYSCKLYSATEASVARLSNRLHIENANRVNDVLSWDIQEKK